VVHDCGKLLRAVELVLSSPSRVQGERTIGVVEQLEVVARVVLEDVPRPLVRVGLPAGEVEVVGP